MLKRGFSLMEMMIVMLIVAVVAAASAPMINKKMLQDQANDSPWVWTGTDNSIAYNLKGNANQTAVIGAIKAPQKAVDNKSKLYVESEEAQITLKRKDSTKEPFHIKTSADSILVSNKTTVPNQSVAIGYDIEAGLDGTTAVGYNAKAIGTSATAIGSNVRVEHEAQGGLAVGTSSKSEKKYAVALGCGATASNESSIAIGGYKTTASGLSSIAIGGSDSATDATKAETTGSIAIGKAAKANSNVYTTAIGSYASATGMNSIAIGGASNATNAPKATNSYAISLGCNSEANGGSSTAVGYFSKANGGSSTAMGYSADAGGTRAIAIGDATASNTDSIAIGYLANSSAVDGYAFGYNTKVSGAGSVAIGRNTQVTDGNTIQLGSGSNRPKVYIPGDLEVGGTLKVGNIDLSGITGTIIIGSTSATVHIPGNMVVEKTAVLGAYASDSYNTYINMKNGYERPTKINIGAMTTMQSSPTDASLYSSLGVTLKNCDRRLKNIGEAFKAGLAEIKKLEVFNYTYKDDQDKTPRVGVMAQDLQKIFPKAVFKGEDGFLRIRMEDMFYALVNAVKELDAKINLLEQKQKRIDELEKRLEKLEKRLEKLEKGK